jgi:dipeptidyl aminopeptidase/acylaminoacyl peptidase
MSVGIMAKRSANDVYEAYLSPHRLVSGGFLSPHWALDSKSVSFVTGENGEYEIVQVDVESGVMTVLLDLPSVRSALSKVVGRQLPPGRLPLRNIRSDKHGAFFFDCDGIGFKLNPMTSEISRVSLSASPLLFSLGLDVSPPVRSWSRVDYLSVTTDVPEQPSPDGKWLASIHESNIVIRSSGSGRSVEMQVTRDGTPRCYWDMEATRIKVTTGRRCGVGSITPWSPDGLTILAYRRDVTNVFRIPRINWLSTFEQVEYLPCQKAGAALDQITPVFVDIRSGRQIPVMLPNIADRYIQFLAWDLRGDEALIIVYERDMRRVDIFAARRGSGEVRTLLTESAQTFVKIWHDAMFSGEHGFRMLPDGSGFLWLSTRSGCNHLYRYGMDGKLVAQLTAGDSPVHEIVHIGDDGYAYFTASTDRHRPYDVHVCRVSLEGGSVEQLTRETGIHTPSFDPYGKAFIDTHSAVDRPTRAELRKSDGTRVCTLSTMDISGLQEVGYAAPEEFTVIAADGVTQLWGVIYKPFNFDARRSYPVIQYIYAGPQTVETPRFFAIDPTMMRSMTLLWALAQLGYIVVSLDGRGTPGRSKAFHDVVCGNWNAGMADHICAIQQLCARHTWMDSERIGITGHSWGGYFSTAALMRAPETYHAAVSYAPHYDPWSSILYEPYIGVPVTDRAAYDDADLIKSAQKIARPLMILAGSRDDNVFSTSMKMTRALIEAGIDHEFVVIPDASHHFDGAEERYLMMKLTGFFERHVKNRRLGPDRI